MGVFSNTVMLCAGFFKRVDVHAHLTEVAHVVEELMADLRGDGMSLGHRELWGDRNTHFRLEVVTDPAGPQVCERLHPWDVSCGMPKRMDHLWVHAVERAGKHQVVLHR